MKFNSVSLVLLVTALGGVACKVGKSKEMGLGAQGSREELAKINSLLEGYTDALKSLEVQLAKDADGTAMAKLRKEVWAVRGKIGELEKRKSMIESQGQGQRRGQTSRARGNDPRNNPKSRWQPPRSPSQPKTASISAMLQEIKRADEESERVNGEFGELITRKEDLEAKAEELLEQGKHEERYGLLVELSRVFSRLEKIMFEFRNRRRKVRRLRKTIYRQYLGKGDAQHAPRRRYGHESSDSEASDPDEDPTGASRDLEHPLHDFFDRHSEYQKLRELYLEGEKVILEEKLQHYQRLKEADERRRLREQRRRSKNLGAARGPKALGRQ